MNPNKSKRHLNTTHYSYQISNKQPPPVLLHCCYLIGRPIIPRYPANKLYHLLRSDKRGRTVNTVYYTKTSASYNSLKRL